MPGWGSQSSGLRPEDLGRIAPAAVASHHAGIGGDAVGVNIGEASSDRDEVARYVMRLSMALGDLRVAGEYAVREDQPDHERLYFVRLFASHMREAVLVLDPPIAVLFQPSRTSSPRCRSTARSCMPSRCAKRWRKSFAFSAEKPAAPRWGPPPWPAVDAPGRRPVGAELGAWGRLIES
jgi:hypothetical protein